MFQFVKWLNWFFITNLLFRARIECQNHWFVYNESMTVESCAQAVSNLAIQFGDSDDDGAAMSRPFGVAILFAGIDEKGPQLYHMDPSGKSAFKRIPINWAPLFVMFINNCLCLGTFVQFDAKAIGSGSEGAQQSLQEMYHKSMTLVEATTAALTILKQVMEEKLNSSNVEVMTMTPEKMFHMFTKEQVEEALKNVAPLEQSKGDTVSATSSERAPAVVKPQA